VSSSDDEYEGHPKKAKQKATTYESDARNAVVHTINTNMMEEEEEAERQRQAMK